MKLITCFLILLAIFSVSESAKRSRRLLNAPNPNPPSNCQIPLWNYKEADNWILAGRVNFTQPYFKLLVKGLDSEGRYKPGKKHSVTVRMHKRRGKKIRMTGFYVTLESGGSITEECGGLGVFKTPRTIKIKTATPPSGCTEPLILNTGKRVVKSGFGKWVAPTCGDVTLRATVRGSDNRLYTDSDSEDTEEQYQLLTMRLSPSVH